MPGVRERRRGALIHRWLESAALEIIPVPGAIDQALEFIEPGTTVTVAHVPRLGLTASVTLACALARAGYRAVPHLGARSIESTQELERHLGLLRSAGIDELMLLGGDAARPRGPFSGAAELVRAVSERWRPTPRIGIAGYPEGHPQISDARLNEALVRKQELGASYIVTQMCFDPEAIVAWLAGLESGGVQLPVVVGVPGAVNRRRLLRMAVKVGTGSSLRALRKQSGLGARMLRSSRYRPDRLLAKLAASDEVDERITGMHLFTFNAIEETAAWMQGQSHPRGAERMPRLSGAAARSEP